MFVIENFCSSVLKMKNFVRGFLFTVLKVYIHKGSKLQFIFPALKKVLSDYRILNLKITRISLLVHNL
jgi:hypothetical protein